MLLLVFLCCLMYIIDSKRKGVVIMKEKNLEMMRYNIQWVDVANELNVTYQTVFNWRKRGTKKQLHLLDLAIETIVERHKEKNSKGL